MGPRAHSRAQQRMHAASKCRRRGTATSSSSHKLCWRMTPASETSLAWFPSSHGQHRLPTPATRHIRLVASCMYPAIHPPFPRHCDAVPSVCRDRIWGSPELPTEHPRRPKSGDHDDCLLDPPQLASVSFPRTWSHSTSSVHLYSPLAPCPPHVLEYRILLLSQAVVLGLTCDILVASTCIAVPSVIGCKQTCHCILDTMPLVS